MRKRLVVSVVIGSILFLQAPAQANHLYSRIKPRGNKTDVVTNCTVGQTMEISSGGVEETVTVPEGSDPDGDGVYEFTTDKVKVNRVARGSGAITGTRTSDDHTIIVKRQSLVNTGITTTQELVVGVGLVIIGVLLLLYGRRPPAGRRPRRRRPPVKVYAQ
jgi:hypothetical protein